MDSAGPGVVQRKPIERPRLQTALAERHRRRLGLVIGGGGAGKSTLLAQLMRTAGINVDVFHTCTSADASADRLIASLVDAVHEVLGSHDPRPASIDNLVDLVLAHSPGHVCLVLDDLHTVDDTTAIEQLLTSLPTNGHLLLSSRRRPKFDIARLDAAGQLFEIEQDDLLLTREELIDFANSRGVDIAQLEAAEGWPAFVELAASGSAVRSLRYLEQEALREIAPDRRRALAQFAFVRGGDDEIATAVTGLRLDELLGDLPLVGWEGDRARLHDLWGDVLWHEIDNSTRVQAALAAAEICRSRNQHDAAIDLAASVGCWDDALATMSTAIAQGVDGGLRPGQLHRWRKLIPGHLGDHPTVNLIDGIAARESDPTSARTWRSLESAAAGFRAENDSELELVALLQLGYVARIGGDPQRVDEIMTRVRELADRHPSARPFLAFGDAWAALARGNPAAQLVAMQSIAEIELPEVWRITRDHLIAHALFGLGRPRDGLAVAPRDVASARVPVPGALVTYPQCLWHSGRPVEARSVSPPSDAPDLGARDLFIVAAWNSLTAAYAGDASASREHLAIARTAAGESPSALISLQLLGLEVLVAVAERRDDDAAGLMRSLFERAPLAPGIAEQTMRNNLALAYALDPGCRQYWDRADLGPSIAEARDAIRALTAAREDDDLRSLRSLRWPEPGYLATVLPCPWAIEFALRGLAAGRQEGRRLASWLCEHWGDPARLALRAWTDDASLGAVARDVLSSTPTPPSADVELRVLGRAEVIVDGRTSDDPDMRRERVRSLLVSLALNPRTTRERLAGQLWPDLEQDKALRNLRTTLNYVHRIVEPGRSPGDAPWFIRSDGASITLTGGLSIDLWRFRELLDGADSAERAGRPLQALPLLVSATRLWQGDLADDLDHHWLDLERIHLRSRFVRACCRAAELSVAVGDPGSAADLARRALAVDPWSRPTHLVLADAYQSLGDTTSAAAIRDRLHKVEGP